MRTFNKQLCTEEEESIFTQLYEEYKNFMYCVADEILHNKERSEDVVQQAMINIAIHLDKLGGEDLKSKKAKNWVALIVRNAAINEYNKNKRHFEVEVSWEEFELVPDTKAIDAAIDEQDLKKTISLLSEKYRDILQLVILYGHDYKTIAALLEITEANARKRFQRAKEMLKKRMREKGEFIDGL